MPSNLVTSPAARKPEKRRNGPLDDRVLDAIRSKQNRHGWCFAFARTIRDLIYWRTGVHYAVGSVQRSIGRLRRAKILQHKRIAPNQRLASGKLTRCGGQHNRFIPRWIQRSRRKQRLRAKARVETQKRLEQQQRLIAAAAAARRAAMTADERREQDRRAAEYVARLAAPETSQQALQLLTSGRFDEAETWTPEQCPSKPDTS